MIRNILILSFFLLLISCKKETITDDQSVVHKIDSIVIGYHVDHNGQYHNEIFSYMLVKDIRYDAHGRIYLLSDEQFLYNDEGQVVETQHRERGGNGHFTPVLYKLQLDDQKRIVNFLSAEDWWVRLSANGFSLGSLESLFPVKTYTYEHSDSNPSSMRDDYSFRVIDTKPLLLDTIGFSDHIYTYEGGNMVKIVSQRKQKDLSVADSDFITLYAGESNFSYDDQPNVWRKLFGDVGFIPQLFIKQAGVWSEWFYAENNVVLVKSGDVVRSISYIYDNKGRVTEVKNGRYSTIKFFYK